MTGATGSLGAYLLDELLADPDVETVYCLCRAKNDAHAADRLEASMKMRKLLPRFCDAHINPNGRVVALASDLSAHWLGLEEARYREIANRVTAVIHVRSYLSLRRSTLPYTISLERLAGQFQFGHLEVRISTHTLPNHPVRLLTHLPIFEPHIRGAVNLMHLALSLPHGEPAKFFFVSSVSSVLNWPGPGLAPEAVMDDPAVAEVLG